MSRHREVDKLYYPVTSGVELANVDGSGDSLSSLMTDFVSYATRTDDVTTADATPNFFNWGKDKQPGHFGGLARLDVTGLRKKAIIDAAEIEVFVSGSAAGTGDPMNIATFFAIPDGRWELENTLGNERALNPAGDCSEFTVEDDVGGTQVGPASAAAPTPVGPILGFQDPNGAFVGTQTASQSFKPTATFTLARIRFSCMRSGNADGELRVRLHQCLANDGTDDRAGALIATSDGGESVLAITSQPTPADVWFDFAIPDRPELVSGVRYVASVEWFNRSRTGGGDLVAGVDHVHVVIEETAAPTRIVNGVAGVGMDPAITSGWSAANYPNRANLPWFLSSGGGVLQGANRIAVPGDDEFGYPYSSPPAAIVGSAPSHVDWAAAVGTWRSPFKFIFFASPKLLVQALVDSGSFNELADPNIVCLGIQPFNTGNGVNRRSSDVRLKLSWHVPAIATFESVSFDAVVDAEPSVGPAVEVTDIDIDPAVRSADTQVGPAVEAEAIAVGAVVKSKRTAIEPDEELGV